MRGPSRPGEPAEEWRAVAERVRNWGRWGPDDQLGTLNYITPEILADAMRVVRHGRRISLSIPVDAYGPQGAHGTRRNPIYAMTLDGGDRDAAATLGAWPQAGPEQHGLAAYWGDGGPARWADDLLVTPLQAGSHWDGLAHVYYDDQIYNGHPASTVTSMGATQAGIDHVARAGGVIGRGVLLDVARHLGVERLEADFSIGPDLLDATVRAEGVELRQGDVVVIRTGWWTEFLRTGDGTAWMTHPPGVSWRVAEWLHERRTAALAADNHGVETVKPEGGNPVLLFHMLAIRDMGMTLGEIWDLEQLGADCASDGVYEFLLVAPPLAVAGGVGSLVNPVAIK